MTRFQKKLVLVEVGVCFLPAILQLFLGLIIAPMQLYFLATAESQAKLGALGFLALVAAGMCGLVALQSVLKWLIYETPTTLKPKTVLYLMGIGLLPLLVFSPYAVQSALGIVTVILPLICSLHLAWLARDHLFRSLAGPAAPRT